MDVTEENLKNPNRWSFDEAAVSWPQHAIMLTYWRRRRRRLQDHIYCLVKNDSYQRFLRSDIFRDLLSQSKKKVGPLRVISKRALGRIWARDNENYFHIAQPIPSSPHFFRRSSIQLILSSSPYPFPPGLFVPASRLQKWCRIFSKMIISWYLSAARKTFHIDVCTMLPFLIVGSHCGTVK